MKFQRSSSFLHLSTAVTLVFAIGIHSALACINTSYSKLHEKQLTGDLVRIVMGEFAEHGDAFFEAEISRTRGVLQESPEMVEAWNDYAVALLKLRRYDESEEEFLKLNEKFPGRYKTHSNLGVLYKKMGRFAEAAEQTRLALEIKPEGHLGLGDYYLRMLDWRERNAREKDPRPEVNFLGTRYDKDKLPTDSGLVNEEYLKTLIIADRHFSDAYVVLGDLKLQQGDLDLAYRCYAQARRLTETTMETPLPVIVGRMSKVDNLWIEKARKNSRLKYSRTRTDGMLVHQFARAEDWVKEFKSVESSLILTGGSPDIQAIKEAMPGSKVEVGSYTEVGPALIAKEPGFFRKLFGFLR